MDHLGEADPPVEEVDWHVADSIKGVEEDHLGADRLDHKRAIGKGDGSKEEGVWLREDIGVRRLEYYTSAFNRPSRVMQTANMIFAVFFANGGYTQRAVCHLYQFEGRLSVSWTPLHLSEPTFLLHHHGRYEKYLRESSIGGTPVSISTHRAIRFQPPGMAKVRHYE